MTAPGVQAPRRTAHVTLTAIGAMGLIAVFLPFSWQTTPAEALLEWSLWWVALPACLPFVILPASVRWLKRGSLSRLGATVTYLYAAVVVGMIGMSYAQLESLPEGPTEWIAVIGPLLILLFGGGTFARNRHAGRPTGYNPILAMQVVYIANAMLALAAFFPDWQVGAYCIVVTMLSYALQIDLVRKAPNEFGTP